MLIKKNKDIIQGYSEDNSSIPRQDKFYPSAGKQRSNTILFILILIYVVIFSYASIKQYNAYNTTLYDLGIFDQVIWNTAHGRFFESSIKGFNFLGDHFSPILILISPLYHIFRDVRILLVLQTFLLAIGAFPIYLIAKRELKKESIALIFAFIYLAYPPLGYLNMFDFHTVSIAVPLLVWAFYLFKTKKWPLFYLCITGALFCKEEIGLIVLFLGIYIFITTRDFKNGILVFALGLLCFLCITLFVIPHVCKEQYLHLVRYKHLGVNMKGAPSKCISSFQ